MAATLKLIDVLGGLLAFAVTVAVFLGPVIGLGVFVFGVPWWVYAAPICTALALGCVDVWRQGGG